MKIVFAKTRFAGPISGADEIAVTYAAELKRVGHETRVLLVHAPANDDPLVLRLREAEVPLSSLASPAFTASLATGRKLAIQAMHALKPARRLILKQSRNLVFDVMRRYHDACCAYLQREQPDVVHVLTPDQGAMMLIRAAHTVGVPVVYQEVGLPFHPPGFEEVYTRFVSVLPLCAGVAVLSPRLAEETNRALPQIGFPIVIPLLSPEVSNGLPVTKAEKRVVRFGFAGRLEYLKGPVQLVQAFQQIHAAHPNTALRIAGDGSQRQEIVSALRRDGLEDKVALLGVYNTLAERHQFMNDIDVFVLPSLTEGTPNAIIEAMAHGKPIVATNVGGIPDLVNEDVGILVSPHDVTALAAALSRLTNDPVLLRTMGAAARKRYEQLFTPRAVVPVLNEFYERVVGRNGNAGHERIAPLHPWAERSPL